MKIPIAAFIELDTALLGPYGCLFNGAESKRKLSGAHVFIGVVQEQIIPNECPVAFL